MAEPHSTAQANSPPLDDTGSTSIDQAVAEGGAYEVIRKRLVLQGQQLFEQGQQLNEQRLEEFGHSDMAVAARVRIRTHNNCVARDIVQVGKHLLFGYNVFIGLKKETKVEDVFALFTINATADSFDMLPADMADSFLSEAAFVNDFDELYRYYKHTKLVELTIKHGKLLAGFQIGEKLDDKRVFRWAISADGQQITYIDNRGERDIEMPPAYDFEWQETRRDDTVHGRHAHVNILDTLFVDTLRGHLTVKVENNTEDGLGIYQEAVEDQTQSIDDASIFYASVGGLVLLKITPYRETTPRYLVFNRLSEEVRRIDAIGQSCVQLPEDHGIIFPGGYYLQTGEVKTFDDNQNRLTFKRAIRSPNGEDILYVFYDPSEGTCGLFAYNIIEKTLANPLYSHGYALAANGQLVIFSAEQEPTRVHPMQIWQTPYVSDEFASQQTSSQSFLGRIGNAELVRGVSDIFSICRLIDNQSVSSQRYEELNSSAKKLFDGHFWLAEEQLTDIASLLKDIANTAERVIDEFEKVKSIREQSSKAMADTERQQQQLLQEIRPDNWQNEDNAVEKYVAALTAIRGQRGHLITVKSYRYIDVARIGELETQLQQAETTLTGQTVAFLSDERALEPYTKKVAALDIDVAKATTNSQLSPIIEQLQQLIAGLDLLSELLSTLKVSDATARTRIIDAISQIYAKLNQSIATARNKRKSLGSQEAIAQFSAQFKLFGQSIANALGMATSPEKCDEQLSRLLVQLEELESQFSDFDQFLSDIMDKREEIYESFEAHKQQLMDERQRKAQSLADAAERILSNIEKRSLKFDDANRLNTYFAADALVLKSQELAARLRQLNSSVKADDVESRFAAIKNQALRALRDKTDIFEDGGNTIKLGSRHKFSVNTQNLDLTIIPRSNGLSLHITGTHYFETLNSDALTELKEYWTMTIESESAEVYRGEYLAALIMDAAKQQTHPLSQQHLNTAQVDPELLGKLVREFANPRYKEGYIKGVHDHDAALIINAVATAAARADLLCYDPLSRGLAQIFWANQKSHAKQLRRSSNKQAPSLAYETWPQRAQSAQQMHANFGSSQALQLLSTEIETQISAYLNQQQLPAQAADIRRAAAYLTAELSRDRLEFIGSKYALALVEQLKAAMDEQSWRRYQESLKNMMGWPGQRWQLTEAWLQAIVTEKSLSHLTPYIPEAIAMINADERLERRLTEVDVEITLSGLLGEHPSISNGRLNFSLHNYLQRMEMHRVEVIPNYHRYLNVKQQLINHKRQQLRLEEFKARPLSSFVRNRLINEAYLPLIGDNFAKQMGTLGENKRTDLMGLLLMISPPGYGKTTLMEYVANRLGLIFMKINCPSLGHEVLSLDPEQAPNATARQELEKLNLALEMGNNVMLYLDDIQHTHPEFLQKFISLCDGTRRIEGVWQGTSKTYDMRGRKFAVVMAGNPYTESGEMFKIPDMLANRADIYNLGDILSGMDEQFSLSYIENGLTSNAVLAPLALRPMADVYKLIDMAKGKNIASTDLSHAYSGAEINEICQVFKKLFAIQKVVLSVNQQYIASAAQNDKYRTEPAFKLQGSYRNMNKMTEKVSAVMNDSELLQMIDDHYVGEAQLLTTGAEDNLLKLAQLRGNSNEQQQQRWQQITKDFARNKAIGDDANIGGKVVAQLSDLVSSIQQLPALIHEAAAFNAKAEPSSHKPDTDSKNKATSANNSLTLGSQEDVPTSFLAVLIDKLTAVVADISNPRVEVITQQAPQIDTAIKALSNTLENSLLPLIDTMDKRLEADNTNKRKMDILVKKIRQLDAKVSASQ